MSKCNTVVPSASLNPAITPTSNLTTTLTWSVPSNTGNGASDASLITYYKIKRFDPSTFSTTVVQISAATTSYAFVLPKGTIVTASIVAANAQGEGPETSFVSATSLDFPAAVTNFVLSSASTELTFTSSWSEPQDAGAGQGIPTQIREYLFELSVDSSFLNTTSADYLKVSLTPASGQTKPSSTLSVAGLVKGKHYFARVTVRNSIGWSAATVFGSPTSLQALGFSYCSCYKNPHFFQKKQYSLVSFLLSYYAIR